MDQKDLEKQKKIYQAFSRDIAYFAKKVCENAITAEVPDFHREIYKLLLESERIVLAAPRGFAKSTIVSKFYPLWLSLFKKRKDICIISSSEGLASEHLRYIKLEIESNPAIKYYWGDLRSGKWTETHIAVRHPDGFMTNIRAKGAGGQIRGFRPDCLICDDLETDDSVESEEQRRKLKNWLFKACLNTLLPGGQFLLIGTVIHPLSVLSELLDTPNNWTKKRFQAYHDAIQEEGRELWPEMWPHNKLQERKAEIGSSAFASEYLNDPMQDEDSPVKPQHIRHWEELPNQLSVSIAVDPAYSEDVKADFKVAVVVGIDQNHNRYLIEYLRTHAPSGEFIDGILSLYERYKNMCTAVGIPNSGTEKEFYNKVIEKASERNIYAPFTELKNTFVTATGGVKRNKKARITAALQPLFEQGKYYIHQNHVDAREELLTIGSSRWDDVVDAMTYAEQILTPSFCDVDREFTSGTLKQGACEGYGIEY